LYETYRDEQDDQNVQVRKSLSFFLLFAARRDGHSFTFASVLYYAQQDPMAAVTVIIVLLRRVVVLLSVAG